MKFRFSIIVLCCVLLLSISAACSVGRDQQSADSTATSTSTAVRAIASPTATDSATATATVQPSSTPTTMPTADATPTSGDITAEIEEQLAQIEQRVAEIRGLQPKTPVQSEIIPRSELHENMMHILQESYSQEEATRDAREMWLLRLIDDPNLDLWQLYVDLYSERVLGYFSPESDALFLISDESGLTPLAQMTMAHEYTHALQNQYFDLQAFQPEDLPADEAAARVALIEGDAELTSTRYALEYLTRADVQQIIQESGEVSSEVVDNAPAYIRESLYFPYLQGSQFAMKVFQAGGDAAIDAAFANPPTSTEQILHFDKFLGAERDEPQEVTLPDLTGTLGAGWSQQHSNTLGEFDVQIMLRENGASDWKIAAAGWDGAQYALYTNGDDAMIVLSTVWDSENDATEFVNALGQTLGPDGTGGTVVDIGQDRFAGFVRNGITVTLVTGTNQAAVQASIDASR